MSARSAGMISALLIGMFAPCADAALKEMFIYGDLTLSSSIEYDGESVGESDSAGHYLFMDRGTGFASGWEDELAVGVQSGDQSAHALGSAKIETSATEIRISMMTSIQAALGSSGERSGSNCFNQFSVDMLFESDTEVEVLTRIEFGASSAASLYGESAFGGLIDDPVGRIGVVGSSASGSIEVGYRAIAPADDYLTLAMNIENQADTDFGELVQDSGVFRMTTVVRFVPAPSGAGLLAALGLKATRRRRNQAV